MIEVTERGRQALAAIGTQEPSPLNQVRQNILETTQSGRYESVEQLADQLETDEIDSESFAQIVDSYILEGLISSDDPEQRTQVEVGVSDSRNCDRCGKGQATGVGDISLCIKCMGDDFNALELDMPKVNLPDMDMKGLGIGNVDMPPIDLGVGDMQPMDLSSLELKEGDLSV